jgi:ribonuclease HI
VQPPTAKRAFGVQDLAEFRASFDKLRSELKPPVNRGDFTAHTDGACLGNPEGPGGWAAVVDPPAGGTPWQLCGHLSSTSNNRAEALGILAALEWIPPDSHLELFSDSELSVRIIGGQYRLRANTDIWKVISSTIEAKRLAISAQWIRGHAGDPRNELADQLTKLAALRSDIDCAKVDASALQMADASGDTPPELVGLEPRTDWERDFLGSVTEQLERGRTLSPKQQAIIDRMRARGGPQRR